MNVKNDFDLFMNGSARNFFIENVENNSLAPRNIKTRRRRKSHTDHRSLNNITFYIKSNIFIEKTQSIIK